MTVFSVFTLLGGLAFFLFGMKQLSRGLEMIAGEKMESMINRFTDNRLLGLLLGCAITVAIQSSSAVTVMLVGLVNSGLMALSNTAAVIMGSNVGTTITAWIMSLIGVSSDNVFVNLLKPESFAPLLAFVGILLNMLSKRPKRKELGNALIGFAILMFGMTLMSRSVAPLADDPSFAKLLTAFRNPLLGLLVGMAVTAVIQSSAASVGMLQALSVTGAVSYTVAIPIILGQNIGTCATALLSSIGANRNAKRVAAVHLLFNLIGAAVFLILFLLFRSFPAAALLERKATPAEIALCHSVFNISTTALLLPFSKQLVRIAEKVVREDPEPRTAFLDERLFNTPAIAVGKCEAAANEMAESASSAVLLAVGSYFSYDDKTGEAIAEAESRIDTYEDQLGTALVRLSGIKNAPRERKRIAKMLRSLGDWERISDYALTLSESSREIRDKQLEISVQGKADLDVLSKAVGEIVTLTAQAFVSPDGGAAEKVEPLEQVIALLIRTCRENHIARLQGGACTLERGFILADTLNSCERIAGHCANIAIAVSEGEKEKFCPHEYMRRARSGDDPVFQKLFDEYRALYLPAVSGKEGAKT